MGKWLLKSATVQNDKLLLCVEGWYGDLSWKVNIKKADIQVILNPHCEEGTWVEVIESTTFGLAPHYVKKVIVYVSTHEAREKWRQAFLSARNYKKVSEVIPTSFNGPDKPYEPRPLVHEPDPAIKF